MSKTRWGLLATAAIGSVIVNAVKSSQTAEFVGVASRNAQRARLFADEHGIADSYGSYAELLAADDVDGIYIALPVSHHAEWTIKALEAGKHVLCEKPFARSSAEAARAYAAAEKANRVCVEGLMWRFHPRIAKARQLIDSGAIGTLRNIRAALSVRIVANDIRRSRELGGGALLDLGAYCVSAIRLFGGEPTRIYAEGVSDGADVDMRIAATAKHANDVLSQFDIGFDVPRRDELELIGTAGKIVIADPWICNVSELELHNDIGVQGIPVDPEGKYRLAHDGLDVYRIEVDAVSDAIVNAAPLPFGADDAIAQASTLEAVARSAEKGEPVTLPL